MKVWVLAATLLLLGVARAHCEIELEKAEWQTSERVKGAPRKTTVIESLALAPGQHLAGRLQSKLSLLNRGPEVGGVLLRYSLTAKIGPLGSKDAGQWAVPFTVEEKRVPKVGANQHDAVIIDPTALVNFYLENIYRDGFWPEEIKIQIMLVPRRSDKRPLQTVEAELPFSQ